MWQPYKKNVWKKNKKFWRSKKKWKNKNQTFYSNSQRCRNTEKEKEWKKWRESVKKTAALLSCFFQQLFSSQNYPAQLLPRIAQLHSRRLLHFFSLLREKVETLWLDFYPLPLSRLPQLRFFIRLSLSIRVSFFVHHLRLPRLCQRAKKFLFAVVGSLAKFIISQMTIASAQQERNRRGFLTPNLLFTLFVARNALDFWTIPFQSAFIYQQPEPSIEAPKSMCWLHRISLGYPILSSHSNFRVTLFFGVRMKWEKGTTHQGGEFLFGDGIRSRSTGTILIKLLIRLSRTSWDGTGICCTQQEHSAYSSLFILYFSFIYLS